MIRPQYHFRPSSKGLLAWDVRRLVELTQGMPTKLINLSDLSEVDENHWYSHGKVVPTCRSLLAHFELIKTADAAYPIILDQHGRVMDGMHRVCKALMQGDTTISAVQFDEDPKPDYVNREPETLPYD